MPFSAIAAVAIVLILTLASYAQLVVVNDQVVELRDSLSQLQSEQTQLAAQYELAYDLQAIEQQMLASGEMIQVQDWQTYTLELAEPDTVEYYQGFGRVPADRVFLSEPGSRGAGIFLNVESIR